jgi:hypothetical protein
MLVGALADLGSCRVEAVGLSVFVEGHHHHGRAVPRGRCRALFEEALPRLP